jgi:hypothetical protein
MDINSFLGFDRGANKEAADYALQNDGQIQLNPLQRLFGADEKDVQNILDRRQQKALTDKYAGAGAQAGLTMPGADWGESEAGYLGRIQQGKKRVQIQDDARADARMEKAQAPTNKRLDLQLAESTNARIAGNDLTRAQMTMQDKRLSAERSESRADRRLSMDLASLSGDREMAIAQMNADLADKRMDYDRETRSMDKRSAAIAQLMSGLGSLGGAFAL